MAILDANEAFFTAFEPKVKNRFIMYVDGIPSYLIKGISGIGFDQGEQVLNHINVYRKVKGKLKWNDVTLELHSPINPSGEQVVMDWVRLHHESVTGRNGYSDFYKKDVTVNILGPLTDIVGEWIIKGAFIKSANFGDFNFDAEDVQTLSMTLGMDYMILNF